MPPETSPVILSGDLRATPDANESPRRNMKRRLARQVPDTQPVNPSSSVSAALLPLAAGTLFAIPGFHRTANVGSPRIPKRFAGAVAPPSRLAVRCHAEGCRARSAEVNAPKEFCRCFLVTPSTFTFDLQPRAVRIGKTLLGCERFPHRGSLPRGSAARVGLFLWPRAGNRLRSRMRHNHAAALPPMRVASGSGSSAVRSIRSFSSRRMTFSASAFSRSQRSRSS
jgi:hypothetical protein